MTISDSEREALLEAARQAIPNAYAPFSRFRVGAAVLAESGNVYVGVNVENSSYSLTICAERSAIFTAVAAEGGDNLRIAAVAVVCESAPDCAPCGACRQVIYEFGPDAEIFFEPGREGEHMTAGQLLPRAFRLR